MEYAALGFLAGRRFFLAFLKHDLEKPSSKKSEVNCIF